MEKGLISEDVVEKAVKHVLMLKAKLGLLDNTARLYSDGHIEFDTDEERATSYQLAAQSIVLLKNGNIGSDNKPILPLTAEKLSKLGGRVFLTGPNANSMWALAGDYTFQAMHYFGKVKRKVLCVQNMCFKRRHGAKDAPRRLAALFTWCDWTDVPETIMEKGGDPRVAEQR